MTLHTRQAPPSSQLYLNARGILLEDSCRGGQDTYDVLRQRVVSHHFTFDESCSAQLSRSPHRYIWPAELDLMAQLAGFELESRHADWSGSELTAESRSHVSVYRLPPE